MESNKQIKFWYMWALMCKLTKRIWWNCFTTQDNNQANMGHGWQGSEVSLSYSNGQSLCMCSPKNLETCKSISCYQCDFFFFSLFSIVIGICRSLDAMASTSAAMELTCCLYCNYIEWTVVTDSKST